jgi:hypothetical protein
LENVWKLFERRNELSMLYSKQIFLPHENETNNQKAIIYQNKRNRI